MAKARWRLTVGAPARNTNPCCHGCNQHHPSHRHGRGRRGEQDRDRLRQCCADCHLREADHAGRGASGLRAHTHRARNGITTGRRPNRSDNGPSSSWAVAISRLSDSVSCTVPASEGSKPTSPGSAGTRILSVAGPIAVIAIGRARRRQGVALTSVLIRMSYTSQPKAALLLQRASAASARQQEG